MFEYLRALHSESRDGLKLLQKASQVKRSEQLKMMLAQFANFKNNDPKTRQKGFKIYILY